MVVTTRTAILQALSRPASGREIIALVAGRSHSRVRLHYGAVHPTLRTLEREGLVRGWTQRHGRGRPRRNYELTIAGVAEAARIRESLEALIAPASGASSSRTPAEMAKAIRGCEEISQLARVVRKGGARL